MNAGHIFNRIRDAEASLQRLQDCLHEAREHGDPFTAFVFESRRRFRYLAENDTKSGKRTSSHVQSTFIEAQKYGFRGDIGTWTSFLNARIPVVDSPPEV